jgi:hypothetical protein
VILELERELGVALDETWFKKRPFEFSVRDLVEVVYAEFGSSKNVIRTL